MMLNRIIALGAACTALLLASADTGALTLGRLHGSALVGKPLDVSVLVQSAADEDISATCFDADVRYGDTPLERGRVSVKAAAGPQPNTLLVRVTASVPVDEAHVSLNLRADCGSRAVRRYVLLSDVVSDLALASPAVQSAPPVNKAAVLPTRVEAVPVQAAEPKAATASAAAAVSKAVPATEQKNKASGARLKLAAVPAATQTAQTAKVANAANLAALEELQRRVDEVAKWQAAGMSAEDVQRNAARVQALESDIRNLQTATARNQKNLQLVTEALGSSGQDNYGRLLVYVLIALVLAAVSAVVYVFLRMRKGGFDNAPWWKGGDERPVADAVKTVLPSSAFEANAATIVMPLAPDSAAVQTAKMWRDPAPETMDLDILLDGAPSGDAGPVTVPLAVASGGPATVRSAGSQSPAGSPLKAINTQEMLDVRQQAEFFMALGRHDDAVHLLESNIEGSADANPLVFLDLLKIFHTLSRRTDFDRYREEFNLQFTGRIPSYANFALEGNGLEDYEEICQQIVVLWPTDYTIDFIEQCLVRTPEDDPQQGIDLEAFKDLLLLYGILKRLGQTMDSSLAPFSTTRTAYSQLSALQSADDAIPEEERETALPEIVEDAIPTAGGALDLDLDLNLDLDLSADVSAEAVPTNNLIDFDMSGYLTPEKPKPSAS